MFLKKKITLGFLISAGIIAALAVSVYITFIEIRKEIRYLELSDTVRSKSLQLRRHEKNFFLYGTSKETENVHRYVQELRMVLVEADATYRTVSIRELLKTVDDYSGRFLLIETLASNVRRELDGLRLSRPAYDVFFPLIEASFLERPKVNAELLGKLFASGPETSLIKALHGLDAEISELRRNGEELLAASKDLDRSARERVERSILLLQIAALIFFPLFLMVGLGTLFAISRSVVNRLRILMTAIEKTGKGDFSYLELPEKGDEVALLVGAFNAMERDLVSRDKELAVKNEELLQSKKLASIGTLASGVAHELNNPLNNIYISAQILERETREGYSPVLKEIVKDIVGQTIRVKQIISDLLEFARGKKPQIREVELKELALGAYKLVSMTTDTPNIALSVDSEPERIMVYADAEQMERVFINLFTNAVEAMAGHGDLRVVFRMDNDKVEIKISDTGKGMPADAIDKIFEPFYTTKDRGTGLGLAIAFNIIKKHAGEIRAASEEGKGTTFNIVLPVKPVRTGERAQS